MEENLTADGDSSFVSTFRGEDLSPLTTEVVACSVTGRSKRSRTESVKLRENQEFEDAVKTATSNKVRRALSNSTNQSFTIDEEDTGKSSSTSSSNNASTNARVHTDSSVSVTQKPPSNVDRLRQKPTITRKEQLKCDFNQIESVNKLFPTQKGKGQFNCPWRFINEAEDAVVSFTGTLASLNDTIGTLQKVRDLLDETAQSSNNPLTLGTDTTVITSRTQLNSHRANNNREKARPATEEETEELVGLTPFEIAY